ncbi:hypothetical protein RFEPED_0267 [Rickettsia felis str. Pedreira]|uniref:Uncharacterized protein n=1 Tax=Rickettsia felis str. Pedreira TaxID=1359196 RepID=A0A0F3MQF8_RICFI|nr:hypothetical protein RFEPED_0267 [Rickettsia felis str. Pedreira]
MLLAVARNDGLMSTQAMPARNDESTYLSHQILYQALQ